MWYERHSFFKLASTFFQIWQKYGIGSNVLDKDGISCESVVAEMAVYLNEIENMTLAQKLEWIYDTYGYHVSNNSYYLCYDQRNILKMFDRLRHYDGSKNGEYTYPARCGKYSIDRVRDLTVGLIVDHRNGGARTKPAFPSSKSSQMITFYFENGCVMTLRTSGTEPKIKWYSEIRQLDRNK